MNQIYNKLISLIVFAGAFCLSIYAFGQERKIQGTVKDDTEAPLSGVNVYIKGSTTGATTNGEGKYTLSVDNDNAVMVFSHQGFKTREIKCDGKTTVDINLETDLKQLNDVVVTATRSPVSIENVPQKVKVINRAEIDAVSGTDVTDLLKKTSGVDVIQYPGLLSGIGIRGFRPQFSGINQRTLLLIDGRPAGAVNLATIDLTNAERVEVLKGPASALYGAQAMGGVVNIITKKSKGEIAGRAFAGMGSFGITEGGFSAGGNIAGGLDFDVSFKNYNQSEDFTMGKDNVFRDALGGDKTKRILWTETGKQEEEVEDVRGDGEKRLNTTYSTYSGAARVGYTITKDWRIDVKGERFYANDVNSPGDIENGSLSPSLKDVDRYSVDAIVQGKFTEGNQITGKVYSATDKVSNYTIKVTDSTAIRTQFVNANNKLLWQGAQLMDRQQLGTHFVTAGIDYRKVEQENLSVTDRGITKDVSARSPNFTQENTGVYLQGELNFIENRLNILAGARYENIQYDITATNLFPSRSQNNNVINPSIGINYNFRPNFFIHTTYGTAFTTVGIFEIAGYSETQVDKNKMDGVDTVDLYMGNPDLKNQESCTFDIGLRYANPQNGLTADVTFFHTTFDYNVVSAVTIYPEYVAESGKAVRNYYSYANAKGTTLSGLEFDLSYDFNFGTSQNHSVRVFANGVYILKAEEIKDVYMQPAPLTLDMANVADLNFNAGFSWTGLKLLTSRLSARYVGHRYDTDWAYYGAAGYKEDAYADIQYPSFLALDWMAGVHIKKMEINLLINNLTDENYYEKRGFNLMGRNYMVKVAVNF